MRERSNEGPTRAGVRLRRVALLVVGIAVLVMAVPGWASLAYRSAVHSLHDELGGITPPSAEVVEEYIDRCWEGVGPASVRTLRPANGAGLDTIRADYLAALAARGFDQRATILTRERDDALDLDVVTLSSPADGMTVQVVADVFDNDLVICLPFD